ncbi:MAG: hypothetical protein ACKOE4_07000 [Candidatus Kapaibacterium sp.]
MLLPRHWYVVPVLALIVFGCGETNPVDPTNPAVYDSTGYAAATADQATLRAAFASLDELLETARTPNVRLSQADINAALAPMKDAVVPTFKDNLNTYTREMADATGGVYSWQAIPDASSAGGLYGGYVFTEHGLDMAEVIVKCLFSAVFYHQAETITRSPLTKESLHKFLSLYGASPRFANSDNATISPDVLVAGYCARRDQNDGKGLYSRIRLEFIKAQSAVNENNATQATASAKNILQLWERSQMATVVNYIYATVEGLSASNVTDSLRAKAMHAYGECVGILTGWRFIEEQRRQITTAQIDELLNLLSAPVDGPWKSYTIWQSPVAQLPNVVAVRERLQDIYGFTDEEMISFKTNWVSAQGRK